MVCCNLFPRAKQIWHLHAEKFAFQQKETETKASSNSLYILPVETNSLSTGFKQTFHPPKLTKLAEGTVVCFQGLKLAVFEFVLSLGFETKTNFFARKHMF